MPTRSTIAAALCATLLAAMLCACAPATAPRQAARPDNVRPGNSRPAAPHRLALAAFHLRDERGGGPLEALRVLDGPKGAGEAETQARPGPDELALRAVALNQLGRYAEAVAALNALILARRDMPPPALADAFVERGLALAALGHQDRAAEDFAAALTLVPTHIPALLARADQLFALGQHAQAEAGYSRVIEIAPKNVLARINRGVTRDEQGRYAEAIDDFTLALGLAPDSPVALVNRGVSRSQAGDVPGMCADYEAACRLGACARLASARGMGFCPAAK